MKAFSRFILHRRSVPVRELSFKRLYAQCARELSSKDFMNHRNLLGPLKVLKTCPHFTPMLCNVAVPLSSGGHLLLDLFLGEVLAALGDTRQALENIEIALQAHPRLVQPLRMDWMLQSLQADSRFADLLRRYESKQ